MHKIFTIYIVCKLESDDPLNNSLRCDPSLNFCIYGIVQAVSTLVSYTV